MLPPPYPSPLSLHPAKHMGQPLLLLHVSSSCCASSLDEHAVGPVAPAKPTHVPLDNVQEPHKPLGGLL